MSAKENFMSTVSLEEAQARLPELIDKLRPGEEVVIVRDQKPVAKLTGQASPDWPPRRPGTLRGTVLYMAPDFNAPLEEFKEYMP
jgi:antitoxin (DNA-binding transcriptional repressor) of toxin-antitoxin stability system